jgi:8-oxo-dGTP diphosphatase
MKPPNPITNAPVPGPQPVLHQYPYPHPAVTVDCVVFGFGEESLQVLLIQRRTDPFRNSWALPGGFVGIRETLDEAARRELREETGVENIFLEQLYTFGDIERDPRERVISVAYYALIKPGAFRIRADTDASDVKWFGVDGLPPLAFDHELVLEVAVRRLKGKLRYEPIGFELLPPKFKLPQLQKLYEIILDRPLDKRNFRKKILGTGLLTKLDEFDTSEQRRPAHLYQFDRKKYQLLKQKGFNFEI